MGAAELPSGALLHEPAVKKPALACGMGKYVSCDKWQMWCSPHIAATSTVLPITPKNDNGCNLFVNSLPCITRNAGSLQHQADVIRICKVVVLARKQQIMSW